MITNCPREASRFESLQLIIGINLNYSFCFAATDTHAHILVFSDRFSHGLMWSNYRYISIKEKNKMKRTIKDFFNSISSDTCGNTGKIHTHTHTASVHWLCVCVPFQWTWTLFIEGDFPDASCAGHSRRQL